MQPLSISTVMIVHSIPHTRNLKLHIHVLSTRLDTSKANQDIKEPQGECVTLLEGGILMERESRGEHTQPECADILNGAFLPPPAKISKHDNYILSPSALPFSPLHRAHLFPCHQLWEKLQGH